MSESRVGVSARQAQGLRLLQEAADVAVMRRDLYLSAILEGADIAHYESVRLDGAELVVTLPEEVPDGATA